jgi:P63C domain
MKEGDKISAAAKVLSQVGAPKGGRARAQALTPEERREIARMAAEKRWEKHDTALPKEEYTGTLRIGDKEIPCANLDNGLRVLSGPGVSRIFGSRKIGVNARAWERTGNLPQLPPFLTAANLQPYIPKDLMDFLTMRIRYKSKRGPIVWGYEAALLPRICKAISDADKAGALHARQKYLVDTAQILIDAFALVGIIALVDEATGYQEDRDREELHKILAAYISEELLPWAQQFPDEFYHQMFRLRGWQYHPMTKGAPRGPRKAGELTAQIVYEKLPPGVLDELRKRNPVVRKWRRKSRHHQFLTNDIGQEHLRAHLIAVTALMRASTSWREFEVLLERSFPSYKKSTQIEMDMEQERHYEMAGLNTGEKSAVER